MSTIVIWIALAVLLIAILIVILAIGFVRAAKASAERKRRDELNRGLDEYQERWGRSPYHED